MGTAGLDRVAVNGNRREPCPPPRMMASVSLVMVSAGLVCKPPADCMPVVSVASLPRTDYGRGNQVFEHARLCWFCEVMIESRFARAALVFFLAPTGQCDEQD